MASEKNLQVNFFYETLARTSIFAEKKIRSALAQDGQSRAVGRASKLLSSRSTRTRPKNTSRGFFEEIDETLSGQNLRCYHGHHRGRSGGDEGVQAARLALDAGPLAAAQAVEHYEIALLRYAGRRGQQSRV